MIETRKTIWRLLVHASPVWQVPPKRCGQHHISARLGRKHISVHFYNGVKGMLPTLRPRWGYLTAVVSSPRYFFCRRHSPFLHTSTLPLGWRLRKIGTVNSSLRRGLKICVVSPVHHSGNSILSSLFATQSEVGWIGTKQTTLACRCDCTSMGHLVYGP